MGYTISGRSLLGLGQQHFRNSGLFHQNEKVLPVYEPACVPVRLRLAWAPVSPEDQFSANRFAFMTQGTVELRDEAQVQDVRQF